jgi:flagellar protein FlgJ
MMTDVIAPPPKATVLPAPTDAPVDPKIWQAAKKFEAMAIGQLLKPMFDTVDVAHSVFGGGEAEATWQPMLVDAIGKQIEAHGGFGLAQPVYAAMLRAQEGGAQARATQAGSTQVGPTQAGLPQTGLPQTGLPQTGLPQTGLPQTELTETGTASQSALRPVANQPRKPR